MSSSNEEATQGADGAAPASRPPKVVLALLALNLVLTGGVAFKTLTAKPAAAAVCGAAVASEPSREVTGPLVAIDPFVVNLNEPGSPRYLKVTMQAEVADRAATRIFEKSKQLIRDELLRYLSGLTVADTLGPANKDKIRGDLEAAVTGIIGENRLHRMIFAEFVVQ